MTDYPIARQHELYMTEIRDEQLANASDEMSEVCRKYGITEIEYPHVTELSRRELYDSTDFIESDNEEDDLEED